MHPRLTLAVIAFELVFSLSAAPHLFAATQQPNGVITFAAAEAKINGDSAKLTGADSQQISSWTDRHEFLTWDYKPTRWGMYDIQLVYSRSAPELGTVMQLELQDRVFPFPISGTQSDEHFRTQRVTRVYLPKSDPFTLKLRADRITGGSVGNVRAVILSPAPEGEPIVQNSDRITLHSRDATTHSVMMRYEPATNKNCLGYWVNPNDAAEWKFTISKPGTYKLELWQGCGKGQGGSDVKVEVRDETGQIRETTFTVQDTGHFQNFVPRDLGSVTFEKAGQYSLWVQPQNKKADAILDIQRIVLVSRTTASAELPESATSSSTLRLATFDIDATPPVGSHLAYDPVTNKWDLGLRARGVVLLGADAPIVLCAVDWLGIANEGHDAFRKAIAEAAGTSPRRVALHALHQHDAPDCDFSAERILDHAGMDARQFEGEFQREVLTNLAAAVRLALGRARPITHLGLGSATVEKVASNRRIFGPEGKVRTTRYTACTDPNVRAEPEGVIDPELSLISFWNGDAPIAVLSYYATHPQSYYRTGIANPDFPGLARFFRQLRQPDALHVHFNGAGGNIGAGKYNDGAHTNRLALAERMENGMKRAWETTQRQPIDASSVSWEVESVALKPSRHITLKELESEVASRDPKLTLQGHASRLAFLRRSLAGNTIDVGCLRLGRARILHMPGELFVEYQLAAKTQRPDLFVAMAAYGDYGPWYIGTAAAYQEGGYETQPRSSNVGPEAEAVLVGAIEKLLNE